MGFKNEDVSVRIRIEINFDFSSFPKKSSSDVSSTFIWMDSINLLNFLEISIPTSQVLWIFQRLKSEDLLPRTLPVALVDHSIKLNNKIRKSTDNFPLSLGQCEE